MFGFSLHFSRWGALATLFIALASIVSALPNVIPILVYESLPAWGQLPRMPLGLDLRGGTHLLYQIDTAQLKKDWLQLLQVEARRSLSEEKIAHSGVVIAGNQVRVTLRDPDKMQAALARPAGAGAAVVGVAAPGFQGRRRHGSPRCKAKTASSPLSRHPPACSAGWRMRSRAPSKSSGAVSIPMARRRPPSRRRAEPVARTGS